MKTPCRTSARFSTVNGFAILIMFCLLVLPSNTASAQRDLKNIPDPDPELERKTFIVADGFEVNLFAADPLIAKPIQMNFDAQGRLWIASSEIYPHIKPGQKANDKILILEDRNHDGKADKTTVFADGLLIPTGVLPGDGGAYVANSTELIHLRDTNSDGRADQRRIILSGFGAEDTHHILHTLRWGHDGMMYMNQSIYIHSHIETPYGVRRLGGGGVWQFRPETMQLNILCRGLVNPWGHHFDQWGQSFGTDGAGGEGINYLFPGSVFVTAPGAKRLVRGLNPGSPKFCGLEILSGRHLPSDWQGNMITNDFRSHRVCRFVVTEDGSGYASRQETELIKTKHVAFRPIDVKVGPDGAIYIADWYNPIIQHGEVDFRDPRRDHVHGRIWRITAKGRSIVKAPDLVNASTGELLKSLKAPESSTRLHAKLILKSHDKTEVLGALEDWLAGLDKNHSDYQHHRLEGLWVYQSLNHAKPDYLRELLHSKDHRVRAAATRVASQWQNSLSDPISFLRPGVDDPHPRVRLETVRALSQLKSQEAAGLATHILDLPMDRFLDFALWQTMRELEPYWLKEVQQGTYQFEGKIDRLLFALRAVESPSIVQPLLLLLQQKKIPPNRLEEVLSLIASLGNRNGLGAVLDTIFSSKDPLHQAALLASLVQSSKQRKIIPRGDLKRLEPLLQSSHSDLVIAAVRAIGSWKVQPLRDPIVAWATGEQTTESQIRSAAIQSLAMLGSQQDIAVLARLAKSSKHFEDRKLATGLLASIDVKMAAQLTVDLLSELPAGESPAGIISPLMSRNNGPQMLRSALQNRKLRPDVAKSAIRSAQQSARPFPPLLEALRTAGGLTKAGWKLTPELLAELVKEVATKGNPQQGEAVFRREELQCLKCHAIGGAGGQVGPDLVSIGASAQVDYLIESLLVPNKKIKENFHSVMVQTEDGLVVTGIVVRQTKTEVVLRDAEDRQIRIATDAIVAKQDGRSLMPDGALDVLTRSELVDLARFLSELGKVGDYAVSKARLVRRWNLLTPTADALFRIRRTSLDTAATDDPTFVWKPVYSQVSGKLPVSDLQPFVAPSSLHNKKNQVNVFLRCHINVTTAGKIKLLLNSIEGLTVWVDGKPTPITEQLILDLPAGLHAVTLAVNSIQRSEPLHIELADVKNSPAQAQIVNSNQ